MHRASKAAVTHGPGLPGGSPSVHLDALRGFAAFCVVLNHLRDALFVDYEAIGRHNPFTSAAYLASHLGRQSVMVFLC
jgi:peptidoglycan/LPS O-acetylase OafA/YrhL